MLSTGPGTEGGDRIRHGATLGQQQRKLFTAEEFGVSAKEMDAE
jgi:hypothetical protein